MPSTPASRISSIRLTARQGWVIRAWAAWTIYVWTTRLWNIWRDDARDIPFKVVHTVLAVISVAFAIAGLAIVSRGRRTAAVSDPLDVVATAPARVDAVRVL